MSASETVDSSTGAAPGATGSASDWRDVVLTSIVALAAFLARLVPVLRGGGLFGLGNYDDGVHFAAAIGLTHGLLPYRDFLLLHPPGIVLALTPFAALGALTGEPVAFAVARLVFMIIGTANAVLVLRILRPGGRWGAVVGGGFYAVFYPAAFGEHSTLLEGLSNCCVLVAVLMVTRVRRGGAGRTRLLGVAGLLLGVACGIKIWGVVTAALLVVWVLIVLRRRAASVVTLGVGVGAALVCLPFFLSAPAQMWRMVVVDQLGRPMSSVGVLPRTQMILGLDPDGHTGLVGAAIGVLVVVGCAVAAWRRPVGRLAVVLFGADLILLMRTPPFFQHYAALTAAPLALVVGSAVAILTRHLRGRVRSVAAGLVFVAAAGATAVHTFSVPFGAPFPAAALQAPVLAASGCVTADDQTALIELNVLGREIDRGCPLVVDLGGYSYDLQPSRDVYTTRRHNLAWQRRALDHLRSGSLVLVLRYSVHFGFDQTTANEVRRWPVLVESDGVALRDPH